MSLFDIRALGMETSRHEKNPGCRATGYQQRYPYYASLYDRSLKQIKRYAAAGLPLDDPDRMGEYLTERGRKPAETPSKRALPVLRLNVADADKEELESLIAELDTAQVRVRHFANTKKPEGWETLVARCDEFLALIESLYALAGIPEEPED